LGVLKISQIKYSQYNEEFEDEVLALLLTDLERNALPTNNLGNGQFAPKPAIPVFDISHLGQSVKTVNIRAGVNAMIEAECVCSFIECQLEVKKRIEDAIIQSISSTSAREEEYNVTEMQFASSNLYEVLGLSSESSDDVFEVVIKRKYIELARRYHCNASEGFLDVWLL
jgi:hypothetical protein